MVRLARVTGVVLLLLASCSSGETSAVGSGAAGPNDVDPIGAFCDGWRPYEQLINSDPDVDEELVAVLLAMEEGLQAVVPSVLEDDLIEFFGGDEDLAQEAVDERTVAFENIEAWITANCGSGGGDTTDPAGALPVRFCAAWDELVALTANDAELDGQQWEQLEDIVDRASADVPGAVADDWAALADFVDRYGDVLVSVEFRQDRITDDMLVQAFGSVASYDEAVAAREAASAAIAEWSLEGCGDFCARWPDMAGVQAELEWLHWMSDDPENGRARLEENLRTLAIFDQLAPDEIHDTWAAIHETYERWVDAWETADFDPERFESIVDDEALEWARTTPDLAHGMDFGPDTDFFARVLEEWQSGVTEVPVWLYEHWRPDFQPDRLDEIREEIEANDPWYWELIALFEQDELPQWIREHVNRPPGDLTAGLTSEIETWVDVNCDELTGRPGTLKVLWPRVEGYAGGMVVMALVPDGDSFEDLADVPGTLAAMCEEVGRDPWGVWTEQHEDENGNVVSVEQRRESDFFRDERWSEDHLCGFHHEAAPPQIDSGPYTLVGGITQGQLGDSTEGFELASCVAVDVVIDSDTVIELPPFEPCDVGIGGDDPDPWRHPLPVAPSIPGSGTLKVLVPELVMPPETGSQDGGELVVVALPAGATLNEVGRQELWPAAAAATWLPPADSEWARELGLARQRSIPVPLAALPPSGSPARLDPGWLAEDPPEDKLPLTVMAPGSYDVRFEVRWHVEEGDDVPPAVKVSWGEASLCAQSEVVIDGDTVIEMPELGECP